MTQLCLFADFPCICCIECGAELHTLRELRGEKGKCETTGGNHLVPFPQWYALYKRAETVEETYALLI